MGISGNERADSAAKAALQKDVSNCLVSYTDTYQYISQYVRDMWQREWDTAVNNKLHATKPLIGEQPSAYRSVRRDEVVLWFQRLPPARGGTAQTKILHLANWSQLIHPGPASSMTKFFLVSSQSCVSTLPH